MEILGTPWFARSVPIERRYSLGSRASAWH
jgi:hypothetical protein